MRKALLQLALIVFFGGWCTNASALWILGEPKTTGAELSPGMHIALELRSGPDGVGKLVHAPNLAYKTYSALTDEQVILLEDAGMNPYTNEQMYYLKSELNDLYFAGGDGFTATQEDALAITFASAQQYTTMEKGEGWTEDNPIWPSETKTPQWDWKNGDALVLINYTSATTGAWLAHIWGWDNYPTCSFNNVTLGESTTAVNAWYAYEVTYEYNPVEDLVAILTEHESAGYANIYTAGDGLGYCDSAAVEAYNQAIEHANELVADPNAADADVEAAGEQIKEALAALKASIKMPEDGKYYYVISSLSAFFTTQGVEKAWYKGESAVQWTSIDRDNIAFVFRFIAQGDGTFAIECVKDNTYLSDFTATSASISTTQSIWPIGSGAFYIKNGAGETDGTTDVYHAQSHSSGAGRSGALTDWYASTSAESASSWKFEEMTDMAKLDSMKVVEAQRVLTETFNDAIEEARADSAAGYVTKWYINSASQLNSNAIEPTEGALANLLDGDYTTFFHSSWSETVEDPHYLEVTLDEPLSEFAVYWKKRSQNNNNRPTAITILASNDGANYTEVATMPQAPDTLPTASTQTDYYSSSAIQLGAAYKYIRFRVDSTNNGTAYFTFSEFNLSDAGFPIDENSMGYRDDMKEAYAALAEAIQTAQAKDASTVTQADIDEINAAIEAFRAAYPDTTYLSNAISNALSYASTASVVAPGATATMGMCTDQTTVDNMEAAANAARAALDANPTMTRSELDAELAKVEAATEAFFDAVIMPEPNKWYFMRSICTSDSRYEETNGRVVYPNSNDVGASVRWGDDLSVASSSPKYMWKFVPMEGEEDVYAVQNIGSGYYLGEDRGLSQTFMLSDTAVGFRFVYITGGELSLRQNKENAYMTHAQASGTVLVPWDGSAGGASSWTFDEVNGEEIAAETTAYLNRSQIYCLPYDVTGSFFAYNDEGFEEEPVAYSIVSAEYDEAGNVTSLGLATLEYSDVIPAGTPFILTIGDATAEESAEMYLDLGIVYDSEINTTPLAGNGLVGVMTSTAIDQAGIGYFSETDGLLALEADDEVTISAQRGYIDGHLIQNIGTAEVTVPVVGGVITDINQAVSDANTLVSVYSVDGKLIRKSVKASEATKGLEKGIYIVNGVRMLVK